MFRVADLEAALELYIHTLDVRLLRCQDYPDGRFTLAFTGYQDKCAAAALELTHSWDWDGCIQGDGYDHLAIKVGDAAVACAQARTLGCRVICKAGSMQHGHGVITFLEDPDGYKVELIQKGTQFD